MHFTFIQRWFRPLLLLGIAMSLLISGCSTTRVDAYREFQPKLDLREYFDGEVIAWGVLQNWRGQMTRHFTVHMVATWNGNVCTLEERFDYNDGETDERTWTITELEDGRYVGDAGDIVGKASGQAAGNALNWHYTLALPVDGKVYHINFDDWMWQLNDEILVNRAVMKKFGFKVAELSIFFQKKSSAEVSQ
ncbi:MAG TPA: DUF3833 domain-containing protein [Porticoccaceae bacterium]|nr:DUF3833 domain-containing protein [Porticoccaceae bacterium]